MYKADTYSESNFHRLTRIAALFLFAPLLAILTIPVAIDIAQKPNTGLHVFQSQIVAITEGSPAAKSGLQVGDILLQVNGKMTPTMAAYYASVAGNYDLSPLLINIERSSRSMQFSVQPERPSRAVLIQNYSTWAAGFSFLMIGWWVLMLRRDEVSRNFFSLCFIFAFFLLDIPDTTSVAYMEIKEILRDIMQLLLPAFFLRFFLQFPSRRYRSSRKRKQQHLLLVPAIILILLVLIENEAPSPPVLRILEISSLIYTISYFLAGLFVFWRRIRRRDRPIRRNKMQVTLVGLLFGMGPFLTAVLINNLSPGSAIAGWQYLSFSLLLVPASFGLAILRYGALDKAFVIRTSLVYGALSLAVLLIYFLIVVGLGHFLTKLFNVSTYPVLVLLAATSGLAIMPLRRAVQKWIDSIFYPARNVTRQTMYSLAESLTGLISIEDVTAVLMSELHGIFRPQQLALFIINSENNKANYERVWQTNETVALEKMPEGYPEESTVEQSGALVSTLTADCSLVMLLDRQRRPIFAEEMEDLLLSGDVDTSSLSLLTQLQTTLLVPLISGNCLLGFFSFGLKNGESLYSQEDLANLKALANQAASAIESRQLYHSLLDKKRLDTELELAREIQASLLPTAPLHHDSYTIAGLNEPCLMVGGDYFDYFEQPDGTLVFTIADVAGKGIPAALLMTSLRVAFKREIETCSDVDEVVNNLNRTVTALLSGSGFICFFCGILDPETRKLTFCNAGMDPPVLFRQTVGYRQNLKIGGPVLGVTPDYKYRSGAICLSAGDRLFLYTDGLTEEQDTNGEFFELHRLLALVEENLSKTPAGLLESIFTTIKRFGGRERSDDKTAIVLELL